MVDIIISHCFFWIYGTSTMWKVLFDDRSLDEKPMWCDAFLAKAAAALPLNLRVIGTSNRDIFYLG